jgi:hypothetical protein
MPAYRKPGFPRPPGEVGLLTHPPVPPRFEPAAAREIFNRRFTGFLVADCGVIVAAALVRWSSEKPSGRWVSNWVPRDRSAPPVDGRLGAVLFGG